MQGGEFDEETASPLPALPRHRPLRRSLRIRRAHTPHPAAGRGGGALPPGLLRQPDLLPEPGRSADRPVGPQLRHGRAGQPRLEPAPPRAPAAAGPGRGRVRDGAGRPPARGRRSRGRGLRAHPRGRGPGRGAGGGLPGRAPRAPLLPRRGLQRHPSPGAGVRSAAGGGGARGPPPRATTGAAARRPGDPPGHGLVRRRGAHSRPADGAGPGGPGRQRPARGDAGDLHHRPRSRLPADEVPPHRSRHGGDADPAGAGRPGGGPGGRRPGEPDRPLSDDLRAGRPGAAGLAPGRLPAAAGRGPGGGPGGGIRRDQLPRLPRAPAGRAHPPLEVHPPPAPAGPPGPAQLRRQPQQGLPPGPRLGRAGGGRREALRPGRRSAGESQRGRRRRPPGGAGRDAGPSCERWQRETGDPLLDGPFLEPPATAVVADPEALSPRTAPTFPAREFLEARSGG